MRASLVPIFRKRTALITVCEQSLNQRTSFPFAHFWVAILGFSQPHHPKNSRHTSWGEHSLNQRRQAWPASRLRWPIRPVPIASASRSGSAADSVGSEGVNRTTCAQTLHGTAIGLPTLGWFGGSIDRHIWQSHGVGCIIGRTPSTPYSKGRLLFVLRF